MVVFVRWFIEANGADVEPVRRPIRPDIDTVLSGLLQIEEHPTAEGTEERGTTQKNKYNTWNGFLNENPIPEYGKH